MASLSDDIHMSDRPVPSQANESAPTVSNVTAGARKPYQPPQLRHLGSVRELTLGTSRGAFAEHAGNMVMVGVM
jgi:hypothetical protein